MTAISVSLTLAAALLVTAPAPGVAATAVSGIVVDLDTGRALGGAVVLVRWFRAQAGQDYSREVCYRLGTARADGAGRFTIAPPDGTRHVDAAAHPGRASVRIDGFLPGYLYAPGAGWKQNKLTLVRFKGDRQEYASRIEELRRLGENCLGAESGNPFRTAVEAEARAFPFLPEDKGAPVAASALQR